jgi:hypothetical protein
VRLIGADGPVATVYFGKSAGPDRVYARSRGANTIYEVGFALRQAKATTTAWLDESLAGVQLTETMAVRLPGYRVRRGNDGNRWLVLPDGGEVEPAIRGEAAQFMQRVVQPTLQEVARVDAPTVDPELAYTVAKRDGTQVRFSYYPSDKGDVAYLYRDDQPWRYTVPADALKQLADTTADDLLSPPDEGSGQGQVGSAGS